nr:MAG TPA: hypothetical protein [Caudoviricetes sp.]
MSYYLYISDPTRIFLHARRFFGLRVFSYQQPIIIAPNQCGS